MVVTELRLTCEYVAASRVAPIATRRDAAMPPKAAASNQITRVSSDADSGRATPAQNSCVFGTVCATACECDFLIVGGFYSEVATVSEENARCDGTGP